MNLRGLRARIAALAAKVPPLPGPVVTMEPEGPTLPATVERALIHELFRHRDALVEAAVGLKLPANVWAWTEEDFVVLEDAGRLTRDLASSIAELGRALSAPDAVIVARGAGGRLSRGDAGRVREAKTEGRSVYILPHVPPLVPQGIDIAAELRAEAMQPEPDHRRHPLALEACA